MLIIIADSVLEAPLEEAPLVDWDPWLTLDGLPILKLAGIEAMELSDETEVAAPEALDRREPTTLGRVETDTTDTVSELAEWLIVGDDEEPKLRTLNVLELVTADEGN